MNTQTNGQMCVAETIVHSCNKHAAWVHKCIVYIFSIVVAQLTLHLHCILNSVTGRPPRSCVYLFCRYTSSCQAHWLSGFSVKKRRRNIPHFSWYLFSLQCKITIVQILQAIYIASWMWNIFNMQGYLQAQLASLVDFTWLSLVNNKNPRKLTDGW